jgi:hypothetical protein
MAVHLRDRITRVLDEAHVPAVDIHEDEPGGPAHVRAPGYLITETADPEERPDRIGLAVVSIVGRDGIPDSARQYERAGLRATAVFALDRAGFRTRPSGETGDGILVMEV